MIKSTEQSRTRLTPEELINLKAKLPRKLLNFASDIRKRLRMDWDIVIAITGEEGSGKSTLAIWLGLLVDRYFDLKENIAYLPSEADIKRKFFKLKRYSLFDIDEAIKALHKYKWFDSLQQLIVEMYATERFQNKASLILIPRFRDLTENFRNHRVKIWINIINRDSNKGEATAIAYLRDIDKDVKDPWYCDENSKIKSKKFIKRHISEITVAQRLESEKRLKNYFFDFKFPPLPKKIRDLYDELKEESRKVLKEEPEEIKKEKWREVVKRFIKKFKNDNPLKKQKEIAEEFGILQQDISKLLKEKEIKEVKE